MPDTAIKKRNRASVACAVCRTRRTKCVVAPGQTECGQCQRSQLKCVIRNDDERRRPTSRAHMRFLTERVALLEKALQQKGESVPPIPQYSYAEQSDGDYEIVGTGEEINNGSDTLSSAQHHVLSDLQTASNTLEDESSQTQQISGPQTTPSPRSSSSPRSSAPSESKGLVDCLLSTQGHISYNKNNGQTRYYGATTNIHVYSDLALTTTTADAWEQNKRTGRVIRDLSSETHDYLMDMYWTYYNTVMHIVHKQAFYRDRENGGTQYYSGFLHICLLAMGFRFADKTKPEMQKISLGNRESTLHREAKYLFEYELEKPGDLPGVQALLVLGDLECGLARDNTGWMYAGMACRLAFDIGLNLDCAQLDIPKEEVQIRHTILFACVIYDEYWALWLGRPTSIKASDLSITRLTDQRAMLRTCLPSGPERSFETQIYVALLELMEHAYHITESMGKVPKLQDPGAYFSMSALDQKLRAWYRRLPSQMKWTPANMETAPFSFFLLHQQFHTLLILVHRPFAQYSLSGPDVDEENLREEASIEYGAASHFTRLSRTICFDNAIQVARIFQCHRRRFNTRQIFVTGMQHAGTAATALIAALALIKDPVERIYLLQHLRILAEALRAMAYTYRPAERMLNVLEHVIHDFGWEIDNPTNPAPAAQTQRNLLSREANGPDSQRLSKKLPGGSAIGMSIGNGNPYPLTPGLASDSQTSESLITTDQYNDFDYTNVPFPAITGANPMYWMKTMSTDNSMMFAGRNDSIEFVSPDDTMMFSSKYYPDFDMPRISKDSSAARDQGSLLIDPLSAYNVPPKKSQRASYMEGGSMPPSTMQRGPLSSVESPTGPRVSWGEVLRQIGDNLD